MIKHFFTTTDDDNIAYHVTNNKLSVDNNRVQLSKKYNFNLSKLKYMNQIHSNVVKVVNDKQNIYECDALVTNKLNTPLMVMVADCIPILFSDEINNTIAVAHAGRNGTFENISTNTINTMKKEFNCKPENIKVTLGASIQRCCYEVSQEMANIVKTSFGKEFVNGRLIDLQGINKKQLLSCGLEEQNITISNICTKCSGEHYFSYRKDKECGRFAGITIINS